MGKITLYGKRDKKDKDIENKKLETAQAFVNVVDIKDKFLYTKDNYIISYIQLTPVDINLYSEREKRAMARTLAAELSSERSPFKFLAVSRPVDISSLLTEYQTLVSETSDFVQKELLRQEMMSISNFALSGEVVERQFYVMLWEIYEEGIEGDLLKRTMDFSSKFENAGVNAGLIYPKADMLACP